MEIIKITNLVKKYGDFEAVKGIDLTIEEKDFYGFIGPNGAGKTTTIKTILNIINKTSGDILIFGQDNSLNLFQKDIGYVPGEADLYEQLTAKEQIEYFKNYYCDVDEKYLEYLIDKFEVDLKKKIKKMSLGNKKKIAIICALMIKPKLLVLDEITNGLDPLMQVKVFEELNALNKEGSTILLSSHNLNDISKYCNKIAIIKDGKIILNDLKKNIVSNNVMITIKSKDSKKILDEINQDYIKDNDSYRFMYDGDINYLLSKLATYKINKITIEDIKLEDIFEEFYRR